MSKLELRLFGGIEIHANAKPVKGLVSRKADALVAYLACNPSLHARELLADLLWDNRTLSTSLGNLRVLLNSVRAQLAPPIIITRQTVHISRSEAVWVDALVFEELLKPLTQSSTQRFPLPLSLVDDLHRALTLYQGEFLAGFYLREAHQFEEWVSLERERYHILVVKAVEMLVNHYIETKQYGLGISAVQRWIQLDPFNEYAHRCLIELLVYNGQRSAALDHYQQYLIKLVHEGLEPAVELHVLYQQISRDALAAQTEGLQPDSSQGGSSQEGGLLSELPHSTVPHNLPSALTPLIGRATELTTIQARLEDPNCRLLTIMGLGGVGKTHLAIEAAHWLAPTPQAHTLFRDGIYLVRLDRVEPDQMITSVIASAINFTFQGALDQAEQLLRFLRGRRMLLLLDNFEHLLHYSDFLDELLQQAPHVKVLVTSRERLEFMGEWLLPIEGLPWPPRNMSQQGVGQQGAGQQNIDQPANDSHSEPKISIAAELHTSPSTLAPDIISEVEWYEYPAPQLFIHTAKALRPDFVATEQRAAIIEICEMVEGLPLGIQLAAAAVHAHSSHDIAVALRRNLDFVNTKMRNMAARHRSLRAAFEHSWQLLTVDEQTAFTNLALFIDGFSGETAHLVADISSEILTKLLNKSLVQQLENQVESNPEQRYRRYRLHPVLHHYAGQFLGESTEHEQKLRQRHCLHFCQFTADREQALNSMSAGEAADALAVELENIRASWQHALTNHLDELLLVMLPTLVRFYLLRGYLRDALKMLETAVTEVTTWIESAIESVQEQQAQKDSMENLAGDPVDLAGRQALLANLLVYNAEIHTELGQYEEAFAAAQRAREYARKGDVRSGEALGHLHSGIALNHQGNYRQAKQELASALTITQEHTLPQIEALAQRHMGVNSFYQGDYTGGRLQHEAAIRYYQETENLFQELRTYHSLAMLYFYAGDYLQARQHYARCLQAYKEVGDQPTMSLTLNNLGAISTQLGDYANARHSFEEALDIRRRIGDRQMEGLILANLGLLMHLMNNHQLAIDYCTQALEVSLDIGERDTEAYTRTCLAHAQLELGQVSDAITNYEQAVSIRKTSGQLTQMLEPIAGLARAYLRLQEPEQALHYVEEILPNLDIYTYAGIVELIRIYLTCYRVLYLVQDPRTDQLLTMGHAALQERAARIVDQGLRELYLENIIAHRELLTEYETQSF